MKVKELIKLLQTMNPEKEILICEPYDEASLLDITGVYNAKDFIGTINIEKEDLDKISANISQYCIIST